jgi:hypothetical protein
MLLKTSSTAASSAPSSAPKSVFARAALRLGLSGKPESSSQSQQGAGLLETFRSLTGGARTAFFRANKEALIAAEAATPAPALAASPMKASTPRAVQAAPAAKLPNASVPTAPEALLGAFHAMKGAEKTAFFRENRLLLKAAAAVVAVRESAQADALTSSSRETMAARGFSGQAAVAKASAKASPESLLQTFQALTGAERIAFWRANHSALKFAAAGSGSD